MFKPWNLNQTIRVQLTPEGRKVLLEHHIKTQQLLAEYHLALAEALRLRNPDPGQEGKDLKFYTFQAHEVIEIFGGAPNLDRLMSMDVLLAAI